MRVKVYLDRINWIKVIEEVGEKSNQPITDYQLELPIDDYLPTEKTDYWLSTNWNDWLNGKLIGWALMLGNKIVVVNTEGAYYRAFFTLTENNLHGTWQLAEYIRVYITWVVTLVEW